MEPHDRAAVVAWRHGGDTRREGEECFGQGLLGPHEAWLGMSRLWQHRCPNFQDAQPEFALRVEAHEIRSCQG